MIRIHKKPFIFLCLNNDPKQRPNAAVMCIVLSKLEETRDERLTSEITTLRAALAEAREENASSRERESKLQSQFETSVTRFDALQKRNKQLMEAERDRSEISVSRKQIQDLQAKCDSLQESLTHAVEQSKARKQLEQIMVQQMNEKLALEQYHLREIDNEKKANHELAERCEQLQLQVKAYEEDFKTERHDRERAHDKFSDREKEWIEQRERLTRTIFTLQDQLVSRERELEAWMKETTKESITVKALKEEFGTVVAKKDEEILRMADLIRELQPIADKYKVLQYQFDAVLNTNHEVEQMLLNMKSEKAAAESRVKDLTMAVGQATAENEALTQQNSQLTQQNEAFEGTFFGMKSKCEALEQENTRLREAICLPDLQTLADKDGRKHPVKDQQEIDKQLPKTAADATPKVPVATSMAPVNIPSAPVATPTTLIAAPRAPVAPPRAPVAPPRATVAPSRATVAAQRATVAVPKAPVATSVAPGDTPSATRAMPKLSTVTTPKSPATDQSANQQQQVDKAVPRKGNIDQSEVGNQGPGKMNTHSTEQDPHTQDANMKDAPTCEKCGKIFPWNQQRLLWKHMQECTGSAESGESVPKATPSVSRSQTQSSQSRYTGLSTTSGSSKSDTQAAATDEDAPKCEKCGRTFPWNQLQLRWKHKCEPTEVARAPDPPRRRIQTSASNLRRPVPVANMEELFTSSTVELGVGSETDDATLTCRCGKTFTENRRRQFVIHKLQCREGTPLAPPRAGRHYQETSPP